MNNFHLAPVLKFNLEFHETDQSSAKISQQPYLLCCAPQPAGVVLFPLDATVSIFLLRAEL